MVTPLKRKAGQVGVLGPGSQGRCPPFIYSSDSKSCFATVAWGCINSLNLKPLPMSFWEACPHPGLKGLRTTSEFQTVSQAQGLHRERHRDPLLNPCLCLSCVPARFAVPAREQHFVCTIKHENLFHSWKLQANMRQDKIQPSEGRQSDAGYNVEGPGAVLMQTRGSRDGQPVIPPR